MACFKYYWPFKKSFFVFFRNVPDARGRYMGQAGYGYVSFERFWGRQQYVEEINSKFEHHQFPDKTCPTGLWRLLQKSTRAKQLQLILTSTSLQVPWPLPETMILPFFLFFFQPLDNVSGRVTEAVTAILEAGRRSLDNDGATVKILYDSQDWQQITDLKVVS